MDEVILSASSVLTQTFVAFMGGGLLVLRGGHGKCLRAKVTPTRHGNPAAFLSWEPLLHPSPFHSSQTAQLGPDLGDISGQCRLLTVLSVSLFSFLCKLPAIRKGQIYFLTLS